MIITRIGCRFALWLVAGLACIFILFAAPSYADGLVVKKIVSSLKTPRSVAIRPDGGSDAYEIFIAESGAGRITKIRLNQPDKLINVVSGFSAKTSQGDNTSPGIYSLLFLDHLRLVVAGGNDDGTPFACLYELAEPESPRTRDQFKYEARLTEVTNKAEFKLHSFHSLTRIQSNDRVGDMIIAATSADAQSDGMVYIPIRAGTLGEPEPTRIEETAPDFHIGGMVVGKSGYVTVAINSNANLAQLSRLDFFNPLDRLLSMQLPTELGRIVALAYSPKTGNLYVANANATDNCPAGIYRIDRTSSLSTIVAIRIAELPSPTALSFAPDGALYVTSSEDRKESDDGSLWLLLGNL